MPPQRSVRLGNLPAGARASVGVDIDPAPAILAAGWEKFGHNIRSYREPLKRCIQQVMAPSFQENFDVGGRPSWQPLAEFTLNIKLKRGFPSDPLVRSGRLRRTAGQLNIWTIQGQQGRAFVSGLPDHSWYGTLHQTGYQGIRARIPQRPFLVIQREDADGCRDVFDEWIEERVRKDLPRVGV